MAVAQSAILEDSGIKLLSGNLKVKIIVIISLISLRKIKTIRDYKQNIARKINQCLSRLSLYIHIQLINLTLYGPNSFFIDIREKPKTACYRLPTHRR